MSPAGLELRPAGPLTGIEVFARPVVQRNSTNFAATLGRPADRALPRNASGTDR
jgi:hypothetical protein